VDRALRLLADAPVRLVGQDEIARIHSREG
jgi:hypothetical protein